MNLFDAALLHFFNQFVERSWTFDNLIYLISDSDVIKGYSVLLLFWWAWFRRKEPEKDQRTVLLTLFAGLSAVVVSRLMQIVLPYRPRPVYAADLDFKIPSALPLDLLSGWSSFPSDHACLFFALATGLCFISPVIGGLALLHAGLIVSLPRIYLGLHYPTDVLAGALLGIMGMALVWMFRSACSIIVEPVLAWSRASPQIFYPAFFLLTAELAQLFKDTRWLAESLWHIAKPLLRR
ncbi:MAG: putative Phosphoesterase, superfamily [Nitrospira sp.]|jgi:undecaprenyl-diphosphatase|nr:putative Phosphoesterase, superfamily [Nitrospira sp.]